MYLCGDLQTLAASLFGRIPFIYLKVKKCGSFLNSVHSVLNSCLCFGRKKDSEHSDIFHGFIHSNLYYTVYIVNLQVNVM